MNITPKNHWRERGQATAVANADALDRPRRSVLAFGRNEIAPPGFNTPVNNNRNHLKAK
jgi:hypothetical protein